MKYRLKIDVGTYKVGEEFYYNEDRLVWLTLKDGKPTDWFIPLITELYSNKDWFEPIEKELAIPEQFGRKDYGSQAEFNEQLIGVINHLLKEVHKLKDEKND